MGTSKGFINAAEIDKQGVYHVKTLSLALSMTFPLNCGCDHFCEGLENLVMEAGSGVLHDIVGGLVGVNPESVSSCETGTVDGGLLRELEPGEKADGAVDYEDIGTDIGLPVKESTTNTVKDIIEDSDGFVRQGNNHWNRHHTLEPEKEHCWLSLSISRNSSSRK
jgi:hypothetical protein